MIDEKILVERLEEEYNVWCDIYNTKSIKGVFDEFADGMGEGLGKSIEIVNQLAEESNNVYFQNGILSELQRFLKEKFKYNSEQAEIWRNGSDKDAYFREKKDLYMDRANLYGGVMRVIERLSEENNNGWIPCSERLPEKYTPVLVLLNNEEMCVFTLETDFEDNSITYWEDWYGYHKKINETIAWQPLPAPFKPKGE